MNALRLLLAVVLTSTAFAADPPVLRRADAKKILEAMEWREVTIVTIQQGINSKGEAAPIYANVVALGKRDSKNQNVVQTMFYDEEYGWYFYELLEKGARLWTTDGFREIRPWGTW